METQLKPAVRHLELHCSFLSPFQGWWRIPVMGSFKSLKGKLKQKIRLRTHEMPSFIILLIHPRGHRRDWKLTPDEKICPWLRRVGGGEGERQRQSTEDFGGSATDSSVRHYNSGYVTCLPNSEP